LGTISCRVISNLSLFKKSPTPVSCKPAPFYRNTSRRTSWALRLRGRRAGITGPGLHCGRWGLEWGCKQSGGVVSDLERRHGEGDRKGNPHLFLSLGIGFVIAAILVIVTSGTAASGLPFVIAAAGLLGKGLSDMRGQQRAVGPPVSTERELLSAIKANGGSITPAEAAMETSLTVREADGMLSELAGGGHLAVESRDGALFYSLPGRRNPELEGR
jgi:hypothetical protein